MIRSKIDCETTIDNSEFKRHRSAWLRGSFYALLCALAFLSPLPASAGGKKAEARASRQERLNRHEGRRGEVPRNARYKNPPREDRAGRGNRAGGFDRPRSDIHMRRHQDTRRHEDRARHNDRARHGNGRHDVAGDRGPQHGKHDNRYDGKHDNGHYGKYDNRYHGKQHYGHKNHKKHYYRSRAYYPYAYFPYYVPVAVSYPYYCDVCHSGFYAEHLFYDHLCDFHYLPRVRISSFLFSFGGTFYFGGW